MQFLTPLVWLAAAAVIVPVVLHLTRKETRTPMLFSSLMFLRKIPIHEVRRRNIRNPLLLLLRCLAILLLVAAFAHPVAGFFHFDSNLAELQQSVVILVDRSLSMSREAVWDRAVDAAQERVQELKPGDEALLIQFAQRAEPLTGWERQNSRLIRAISERLEPSAESTSYAAGLDLAAQQLEQATSPSKEIFLITDLQSAGLDLDAMSQVQVPGDVRFSLRDVGEPARNAFIEEVRLQRQVYSETYPHSIVARISVSDSQEELPDRKMSGEIQLFVGETMIERQSFELTGEGSTTATFDPFEIGEGAVRGRLVLDLRDDLAADDVFYFVVERVNPFQIALLSGQGDTPIYLKDALESGRNLPFVVTTSSDNETWDKNETSVVVLDNVPRPDDQSLGQHLERGGSLIIALGKDIRPSAYESALADGMPCQIIEKRFAGTDGSRFVSITEVTDSHPIFEPFLQTQENALTNVQFFGYWKLEPAPESQVLARFDNGDPALIEQTVGNGRVLVFASSLGRVWSDFPLRSAYVSFWQRTVQYMGQWGQQAASLTVNQILSLEEWNGGGDQAENGKRWDFLDPRGQRLLTLDSQRPESIRLESAGYYELRKDRTTNWFAVNTDRGESDLARVEEEEFSAALRNTQVQQGQAGLVPELVEGEAPQPLWWLFLLAAIAILMVEAVVANRRREWRMTSVK
ncbi:MAG TPA: BatA domain-containing protein [Acidobacteriota bacterium]|nr:BatA domain-containing protein [Acidobacteriota bacterium]